jgi:hypothetical protein
MGQLQDFLKSIIRFSKYRYAVMHGTVIIINDELDHFEEKSAKIIQSFLYQIR